MHIEQEALQRYVQQQMLNNPGALDVPVQFFCVRVYGTLTSFMFSSSLHTFSATSILSVRARSNCGGHGGRNDPQRKGAFTRAVMERRPTLAYGAEDSNGGAAQVRTMLLRLLLLLLLPPPPLLLLLLLILTFLSCCRSRPQATATSVTIGRRRRRVRSS